MCDKGIEQQTPSNAAPAYYVFDMHLPYALRLPLNENIEFTFQEQLCCFVHCERQPNSSLRAQYPKTTFVPADKYGLYFHSRILIVLSENVVSWLHTQANDEVRKLFDLDSYVAHCFALSAVNLKEFVVGALNQFLSIYRVIAQDWHVTPIVPKDLVNIRLSKSKDGKVTPLTELHFGNQVVTTSGNDTLEERQLQLLKQGALTGGKIAPLATLEADIHDKVNQGDFLSAIILIGLLVEEAVKDHVIRHIMLLDAVNYDDAISKITRKRKDGTSHFFGINDLVDKGKKENEARCFVEARTGWRPYDESVYTDWDKNVRGYRNEIIHAGRKDISANQVNAAWTATFAFISLSKQKLLEHLCQNGISITQDDVVRFYALICESAFSPGLIGDFNRTGL